MEGLVRKMGIGVGWEVDDSGLVEANQATDGLVDTTEDAESAVDGLSDAGQDAGSSLSNAFDGFTDTIGNGLEHLEEMKFKLGAVAAAGTAAMFKFAGMAGDLEERINTLDRQFSTSSDRVIAWARDYARATELTEMQTIDWAASLGIQLEMLDLAPSKMADMTEELIKLSHEYAHYSDLDPSQAFNQLEMALRGGRFPQELKNITGQIRRTDIEQKALTEGLIEHGEEMDQQAERMATFLMLQEELTEMQGAAAAGQNEWNTRMSAFRGVIGDISREIGFVFLPTLGRMLGSVTGFLNEVRESRLLRVAAGIGGIGFAVIGLAAGLGFLAYTLGKVKGAIGLLAGVFGIGVWPLLAFMAGGVLLALALEDIYHWTQDNESVIGDLIGEYDKWKGRIDKIVDSLRIMGWYLDPRNQGFHWQEEQWDAPDFIQSAQESWQDLKDWWGNLEWPEINFDDSLIKEDWESLKEWWNNVEWPSWPDLKEGAQEKWDELTEWIDGLKEQYLPEIKVPTWPEFKESFQGKWNEFTGWLDSLTPIQTLKDAFEGFRDWLPEMPEININLDDIVTAVMDDWKPITWLEERFEGFKDWFPELPDIEFGIMDIVDTIYHDWKPITWLQEKFEGFQEWRPTMPEIKLKISEMVEAITNWSPVDWLSIAFAGFSAWIPEKPSIDIRLSDLVDAVKDWWPIRWLRDAFDGFKDWLPEFPDLIGAIQDWWNDAKGWVSDNLSWSGLIGGIFGGDDSGNGDAEKEAQSTPAGRGMGGTSYSETNNDYDIDINVEGADSPEQTANIVEKRLKRFLQQESAEAGAN